VDKADKLREQQFQLLVQGVVDYAVYIIDPRGHVTNWNAGGQRIKGYSEKEIVGQHFSCFYTPEERDEGAPMRALQIAAERGKFEGEGWRVRKDGTRFWASVTIDRLLDASGELIGFAKVTRDVTEKHETQQRLETLRE